MNGSEVVRVSVLVPLSPAEAFDLFTTDVDSWWRKGPRFRFRPGADGTMRFEPRVGGRLLEVYDEAGEDCFVVGTVRSWEPPTLLAFEFRARSFEDGQTTEVEVRFEPAGSGTRVNLVHRGWDELPPDHPARHGLLGASFQNFLAAWWGDLLVTLARPASRGGSGRS